ncbi:MULTISPECIES: hypothetical protein [Pontibacter]|uniref:Uncharacterized protein n=1 Tax=Pontibacter lucknowensis TaxID=1077936 RepID=A0A1N6UNN3_9BACT|nr:MULTISPECIES: hypothetical protein [Pontibacter]EJF09066.1 hypothetical protein O71_17096 [Pontibacter sp. BAB1700]SIQ67278.1 hypothetical protein SAMN05421545_0986 [Pontibacter lucknowensis]
MRQIYKNTLLAIVIFLLILLMQSLRNSGLYLAETLPLGLWYAIGLTGALVTGRVMLAYTR